MSAMNSIFSEVEPQHAVARFYTRENKVYIEIKIKFDYTRHVEINRPAKSEDALNYADEYDW